jgi:hypothetical protein
MSKMYIFHPTSISIRIWIRIRIRIRIRTRNRKKCVDPNPKIMNSDPQDSPEQCSLDRSELKHDLLNFGYIVLYQPLDHDQQNLYHVPGPSITTMVLRNRHNTDVVINSTMRRFMERRRRLGILFLQKFS